MGILELFMVAVGLAMDAFAVSICKGLSLGKIKLRHMAIAGLWFGGFQAIMPAIGYLFGSLFADKMDACMDPKCMFILAVATSIDALAVGVSFAFLRVSIVWSVLFIGVITFVLSAIGVKIGSVFGAKYKSKAEIAGGIVLILIGTKILLEHLGIIG